MNKFFLKTYANTSTVAASKFYIVPVTDSDRENYAPFNELRVLNNSGQDIDVVFSGVQLSGYTKYERVPAGCMLEIPKAKKLIYSEITIANTSSLNIIPIGELVVTISRV